MRPGSSSNPVSAKAKHEVTGWNLCQSPFAPPWLTGTAPPIASCSPRPHRTARGAARRNLSQPVRVPVDAVFIKRVMAPSQTGDAYLNGPVARAPFDGHCHPFHAGPVWPTPGLRDAGILAAPGTLVPDPWFLTWLSGRCLAVRVIPSACALVSSSLSSGHDESGCTDRLAQDSRNRSATR